MTGGGLPVLICEGCSEMLQWCREESDVTVQSDAAGTTRMFVL